MSWFGAQDFYEAESEAHDGIQEEFGEVFVHTPCISLPNQQPQPDPARPAYAFVAIFGNESRLAKLGMEDAGVSSSDPVLYAQSDAVLHDVEAGDRFERCRTGDLYQATDRRRDSTSGIEIPVVQMGRMD